MTKRNLTIRDYLTRRFTEQPARSPVFSSPKMFENWRRNFVSRLEEAFGPPPPEAPLNPETLLSVELGDIRAEKIIFDSSPYSSVSAWLLIPAEVKKGQKRPTIFIIPGHTGDITEGNSGKIVDETSGKAWVVGLLPNGTPCSTREYNDIGQTLCRAGFVVFCPDMPGFGERACEPGYMRNRWSHVCNNHLLALKLFDEYGLPAMYQNDIRKGMNYLLSRPEVDSDSIGMAGLSSGGTWVTYYAALDTRVRAMVAGSFYPNCKELVLGRKLALCGATVLPGLATLGADRDFLIASAPRPLMIQIGKKDPAMSFQAMKDAPEQAGEVYRMLHAEEHFALHAFSGGHEFDVDPVVQWFARWL